MTTKMETHSHRKACSTDLCLRDVSMVASLLDSSLSSLVGVAIHVNLSGLTSFEGVELLSVVWRPQGSFAAEDCPLCKLKP